MKADILHPQSVKQPPPPHGGLGSRNVTGSLGPRLLDRLKEPVNGLGDRDGKGLLNASLGTREKDGLILEVNARTGDRALLEAGAGGQPNFE